MANLAGDKEIFRGDAIYETVVFHFTGETCEKTFQS